MFRRRRTNVVERVVMVLLVLVAAGVPGTLMAGELVLEHRRCGSVDPTDQANYATVRLVNDTSQALVVSSCEFCHGDLWLPSVVLADGSIDTELACGYTSSIAVSGPSGQRQVVVRPATWDVYIYRLSDSTPDPSVQTPVASVIRVDK